MLSYPDYVILPSSFQHSRMAKVLKKDGIANTPSDLVNVLCSYQLFFFSNSSVKAIFL